jgi:hypothetical protein
MGLWDKLSQELDRAGKVAQSALDEGKIRLEAFRARQLADKAAQALGYAVYRAHESGIELDAETRDRLMRTLAEHESEAKSLEEKLEEIAKTRRAGTAVSTTVADAPATAPADATATDASAGAAGASTNQQPPDVGASI